MGGSAAKTAKKFPLPQSILATRAAWLHHVDKKTNVEIANELGIHRLRVPKLLDFAEESGIATISVAAPSGVDARRSDELRVRFGLSEALVVPTVNPAPGSVGALAARYVGEVLIGGGRLGLAWGKSISEVVAAVEATAAFPKCDIVQLIGGIPALERSLHASELLGRLGAVTAGRTFALHAPMILPSAATAAGLRTEESIARTLAAAAEADVALVGVGSWEPPLSRVIDELTEPDRLAGLSEGITADICGIFVDRHGQIIGEDISERMISVTADDLRRVPLRVAVAYGQEKVSALAATLKSGLINVIVTDGPTADGLMAFQK
jgi:DNA-binding transcriptional regulator LsrR (DeoR family)